MTRYIPMLAKPLTDKITIHRGQFVAQEKYNGMRLLVRRYAHGDLVETFDFWSRSGKQSKLEPLISRAMRDAILLLPHGVYDGELIHRGEGKKHYDVANHLNVRDLRYVIFDVLENNGVLVFQNKHSNRRALLQAMLQEHSTSLIRISEQWTIGSRADVNTIAREVWDRFGEGLILRNENAAYFPGKRSDAYLKVKLWHIDVAPVVGFEATRGEIMSRGECAVTVLQDAEGNLIPLKTLDDETCEKLAKNPNAYIGRNLMFEYTGRTPDGKYENPKWDRWAEDDE